MLQQNKISSWEIIPLRVTVKFWRVLNENLIKGERNSSDVTFSKGNDEYTNIDNSCEFMNDHFAGIGKKLYDQFNNDLLLDNYECMYDFV